MKIEGSRQDQLQIRPGLASSGEAGGCPDFGDGGLNHEPPELGSPSLDSGPSRVRRGKRMGQPHSLPIQTYNEMFEAYLVVPSAAHAARMTGVSARCARKYVERGDPRRGLPPLRQRYDEIQAGIVRRENESLRGMLEGPSAMLMKSLFDPATGRMRDPRLISVRNYIKLTQAEIHLLQLEAAYAPDGASERGRRESGRERRVQPAAPAPSPAPRKPATAAEIDALLDILQAEADGSVE